MKELDPNTKWICSTWIVMGLVMVMISLIGRSCQVEKEKLKRGFYNHRMMDGN